MNREKFMKYQITHPQIQCRKCGRILSIENFAYNKIYDNDTGICRSCDWVERNRDKMVYKNYTKNTLDIIVRYIFEFKGDKCIINNLQDILNLTLGEIIEILQHLKIGNKPYSVRTKCEYCQKEVIIAPSVYLKNDNIYIVQINAIGRIKQIKYLKEKIINNIIELIHIVQIAVRI